MIGKLKGTVDCIGAETAIIDVGGVGYEVTCSARTLGLLPPPGAAVTLAIETQVREDAIRLFGFLSEAERGWFRLLQSVQGVGTKVALSILSTLDVATLAHAIALQDKAMVSRAPGVGPKVALRIVNELKDKAPAAAAFAHLPASQPGGRGTDAGGQSALGVPFSEALSALINLGYASAEANSALAAALSKAGEGARTEELIRLGLKELGTPR